MIKTDIAWLMFGDCLERMKELDDNSIDLIVTDPPYDIKNTKPGGKSALAKSMKGYNNELSNAAIVSGYDVKILDEMVRVCRNINIYIFCNKAQLPLYMHYFVTGLGCSFDLIKWVKTNSPPTFNNKYLSDTEYCFYARKSAYCNPDNYKDASTLYHAPMNVKDKRRYGHPTIKPTDLITRLIRNSSRWGDTILDPFMGSGTTGDVCRVLDRQFIGIELNPEYYGIAAQRVLNETTNKGKVS